MSLEETTRPGVRLLSKAICQFREGDRQTLYATEMSLGGAFILSMQPPHVGTRVDVVLHPSGLGPLGPIGARVVRSQVDPAAASRTGFEVVFAHLDDTVLASLSALLSALGRHDVARRSVVVERRGQPRVPTNVIGSLEIGPETLGVRVVDLSMSGALMSVASDAAPHELPLGTMVTLHLTSPAMPESFSVAAEIVRFTRVAGSAGAAVRFGDMDARTRARVEGIMLSALAGE
jgi:hypothetical protein